MMPGMSRSHPIAGDLAADNVTFSGAPATHPMAGLVDRIRTVESEGMTELYDLFSRGVRFYLCRQLGPQDLDDKVHDTFLLVVQAIRRGELREPERLMGFIRTVVRRQAAMHIERRIQTRKESADVEAGTFVVDARNDPEGQAINLENEQLVEVVLRGISERDREILTRFYLKEQTQEEICGEMKLSYNQFRLLKSRAKRRFGELGKKKFSHRRFI